MFAEELSGNASRRKQEEARARRRKLKKQQQEQQEQQEQEQEDGEKKKYDSVRIASLSTAGARELTSEGQKQERKEEEKEEECRGSVEGIVVEIGGNIDDVRRRREEYEEHWKKMRWAAAVKIQCLERRRSSNAALVEKEGALLDSRLSDLSTLRNILKQAKNQEYVAPPATASAMTTQLLFLTRRPVAAHGRHCHVHGARIRTIADANRLVRLLQDVLLPGLLSADDEFDPMITWLSSPSGMFRFQELLRLCLSALTASPSLAKDNHRKCADSFIRCLLGLDDDHRDGKRVVRDLLVKHSLALLLSPTTPPTISPASDAHNKSPKTFNPSKTNHPHITHCRLDLLAALRDMLLWNTGGPDPIPPSAETAREDAISPSDRHRTRYLFMLVIHVLTASSFSSITTFMTTTDKKRFILNQSALRTRFVLEIFTVPLLLWKLPSDVISSLLFPLPRPQKQPSSSSSSSLRNTHEIGRNQTVIIPTLSPSCKRLMDHPPMLDWLREFVSCNPLAFSNGDVLTLFRSCEDDLPLTQCPAPALVCLFANLVQLGRMCPLLGGGTGDIEATIDFPAASFFFNFLATLLDTLPLGTLSSRRLAVEWVTTASSQLTPIVLSSVVMDQCKAFLLDSYVRSLFLCAVQEDILATNQILSTKDDKDLKMEREMMEVKSVSAASMAAREATVDRTKKFWQSSRWARKLSQSVKSMFGPDELKLPSRSNSTGDNISAALQQQQNLASATKMVGKKLMNTSALSRKLAYTGKSGINQNQTTNGLDTETENEDAAASLQRRKQKYTTDLFFALLRLYGTLLSRWGGGGKDDIVQRTISSDQPRENSAGERALGVADPCVQSLLNVLCFSTGMLQSTWALIQSDNRVVSDLYNLIDHKKRAEPVKTLSIRPIYNPDGEVQSNAGNVGAIALFTFLLALVHALIITDDVEIHEMDRPIPAHQLRRCIRLLKNLLLRVCCVDVDANNKVSAPSDHFGLSLIAATSKTMKNLYDRSSRRPLCMPKLWLVDDLLDKELRRCRDHDQYVALLHSPVLHVCPFLVSFKRRLKLFERIVTTSRIDIQGTNENHDLRPAVGVRITRGRILEDGLITLNNLGPNLRQRISVTYYNEAGVQETGVDAGGLFKDFWTDLSQLAFNPNYALFRATEGGGDCLYPNPASSAAHGSDANVLFEFLGRILGKALYEGITIQPQFAHFFLSFLKGDYNFLHMLADLSTMDEQLYNNLMFLKTYDGDAADLCLTFTVANDDFGGNREIPLVPNGSAIEVTNANKHRYILLVAKHHVSDRVREPSIAFTRGLWEVIDRSWLRIFNEPELQVLISGATDGKIDISDMKANTRYVGGYTGLSKPVYQFWNVMESLNSKQQADLLRFVTSCERPPPLGFSSMNPPFTIQRVFGNKLPSSSTCFNTLKLPSYSSEKVLKERLLYALESGAGFELT